MLLVIFPSPTLSRPRTPGTATLRPPNITVVAKWILPPRRLTQILTARIRLATTRLRCRIVTIYTNGHHRKPRTLLTRSIRRRAIPFITVRISRPGRVTYIPTARIRRAGTALRDRAVSKVAGGVHRTRVTYAELAGDIVGAAEVKRHCGCGADEWAAGVEFAVGGAGGGGGGGAGFGAG